MLLGQLRNRGASRQESRIEKALGYKAKVWVTMYWVEELLTIEIRRSTSRMMQRVELCKNVGV